MMKPNSARAKNRWRNGTPRSGSMKSSSLARMNTTSATIPGSANMRLRGGARLGPLARCAGRIVALCLLAAGAGCAGAADNQRYAAEPDPRSGEYIIGAADELDIQVWKNPELNTKIR